MKSLKTKLLMVIIPIFGLALSLIAYINHDKAQEFLVKDFENEAYLKLRLIQSKVDDWTLNQKNSIKILSASEQVKSQDAVKQISLNELAQSLEEVTNQFKLN